MTGIKNVKKVFAPVLPGHLLPPPLKKTTIVDICSSGLEVYGFRVTGFR